jgi:hypothetical protein
MATAPVLQLIWQQRLAFLLLEHQRLEVADLSCRQHVVLAGCSMQGLMHSLSNSSDGFNSPRHFWHLPGNSSCTRSIVYSAYGAGVCYVTATAWLPTLAWISCAAWGFCCVRVCVRVKMWVEEICKLENPNTRNTLKPDSTLLRAVGRASGAAARTAELNTPRCAPRPPPAPRAPTPGRTTACAVPAGLGFRSTVLAQSPDTCCLRCVAEWHSRWCPRPRQCPHRCVLTAQAMHTE